MRGDAYGAHGERRLDALLATLRRRRVDPFITPGSVLVDLGCGHAGSLLNAYSGTIERGIGFDVSVGPAPPRTSSSTPRRSMPRYRSPTVRSTSSAASL